MEGLHISSFIGGAQLSELKNVEIPDCHKAAWNAVSNMEYDGDVSVVVVPMNSDTIDPSWCSIDQIEPDVKGIMKWNGRSVNVDKRNVGSAEKDIKIYFETTIGAGVPNEERGPMFDHAFIDACGKGKCTLHILNALVDFALETKNKELLAVLDYHASYDMLTALYLILQPYRATPVYITDSEFTEFIKFFKDKTKDLLGDYAYNPNSSSYVDLLDERNSKKMSVVMPKGKKSVELLGDFYRKNHEHYPERLKDLDAEDGGGLMLFLCEVETRIMAYTRYLPAYEGMENFYASCFKLDEPFILNKNKILSEMMIGSYIHMGLLSDAVSRKIEGDAVSFPDGIKLGTFLSLEDAWKNCHGM